MTTVRVALLLMLITFMTIGCSGEVQQPKGGDDDPTCAQDATLAVPSILFPTQSEFIVTSDRVAVLIGSDDLGAGANALQFELWLMSDDAPVIKVWGAVSEISSVPTMAGLSEGSFETGFTELTPWRDYAYRARTLSQKAECSASEWSEYRGFRLDDGSERIFDKEAVREVRITLSQDSYDSIDAEALTPNEECIPYHRNYYPGTVEFDGTTYENAGIRVKGGCGSARRLDDKPSFKINLSDYSMDETCPETRRASGLKRLTLNNQVQDDSNVHEQLAYRLYGKAGVPAARSAPVRVYVNDELFGLYLNLESFDRRFLARRFRGKASRGMLYEGTYDCDWLTENLPEENGPETCFSKKFSGNCSEPGPDDDPYSYAPLIEFLTQVEAIPVGDFYNQIREIVDFDAFLSQWAVESIIQNWDSAFFNWNNYRVYHNPVSGKWVMIPSGVDQAFEYKLPLERPWVPANFVAKQCLRQKECEDAFAGRLEEVLQIYEQLGLDDMAEEIRTQIRPEVEADPRKENTTDEFEDNVDGVIDFIRTSAEGIRTHLSDHGY